MNVTQSVTQRIRDLDLQRFKLDQQITTGQKITYAEDDGSTMSRTIQLDSQKSRLSQYQRNASYASEFINAGQMNLEKLREINQRAQEIARIAGGGLNNAGIDTYSLELDQLIDETLNRINSRHRGKSLFGGLELKPDFAHSEVISEKPEMKVLDLNRSNIGVTSPSGVGYLKQGDEVVFQANGREYVVQAKMPSVSDYDTLETYNQGDMVKVTETFEDSILVDSGEFADLASLLSKLGDKDWSKQKVGYLHDNSADVYLLDASQIEQVAVSLGNQPYLDFFPSQGGYFAIHEDENGEILLEPAENKIENWRPDRAYSQGELVTWGFENFRATSNLGTAEEFSEANWQKVSTDDLSEIFMLTERNEISYWEATRDGLTDQLPSQESNSWLQINPSELVSNVSTDKATSLIRDLINSDSYFLNDSKVYETVDSFAFVRGAKSSTDSHDHSLSLSAKVNANGQLEVKGTVGKTFSASAQYMSMYDTNNYFPEQLESMVVEKGRSLYPNKDYSDLTNEEKDKVWDQVKKDKLQWELNVTNSTTDSDSFIEISLSEDWQRLGIYQLGDIVQFDGKLWESVQNENFNHSPSAVDSKFWKELGSDYEQNREDWNIVSSGTETRFYYTGPDGRLFSDQSAAIDYTFDVLLNSTRNYTDPDAAYNDAVAMVQQVAYPVSRFEASANESNGIVYFDSLSQSYRLAALADGQAEVGGTYMKGDAVKTVDSEDIQRGDVIQHRGSFFLATNVLTSEEINSVAGSQIINDVNVVGDLNSTVGEGEKIFEESTGRIYMLLGTTLPTEGREMVMQSGIDQPLRNGAYIFDPATDSYYVAQENTDDANLIDLDDPNSSLVKVNSFSAVQGAEWSVEENYKKGQIVFYDGIYYECQTNGKPNNLGEYIGFDNKDDEEFLGSNGDYYFNTVTPGDQFFYDVDDAISEESLNLRRARGEEIHNNVWLPVSKSVDHVLKFEINNLDVAEVKIESAGPAGIDAKIKTISDVNGIVTGLQVANPGRYFFSGATDADGTVTIPDSYQTAEVILPNGDSIRANIIWGQNPNDPGPFIITGFELLDSAVLDQPMGATRGDSYSFATGNKTFLDHRDQEGRLIGVTYTGSNEDAEFYVGKDSKISSFLNAENGGTSELADVIDSLVELRRGLSTSDLGEMIEVVQLAEKELIEQEDSVIDKIGELSSTMVRMNTVRSHDEEYFLEIDQRLAQDLDVDLSEAIMQLTRVSTAYQAAMQVGAQLLNTSLLNYL